jgi:hypothetical protein
VIWRVTSGEAVKVDFHIATENAAFIAAAQCDKMPISTRNTPDASSFEGRVLADY